MTWHILSTEMTKLASATCMYELRPMIGREKCCDWPEVLHSQISNKKLKKVFWGEIKKAYNTLGKVSIFLKKMIRFIQRSSDPIQPSRALDKKIQKFQFFLWLYYLFNHQIWGELWRQNWYLPLLKCFGGGEVEVKKSD